MEEKSILGSRAVVWQVKPQWHDKLSPYKHWNYYPVCVRIIFQSIMIPRPNCDFRSGLAVRREKKILINCFSILISILELPASFMRHFCPSEAPFSDKLPLEKYIIHAKESLKVCIDVRLLFFNWHWNWLMFASISYLQHILILSGEIHLWSNWLEVPVYHRDCCQ